MEITAELSLSDDCKGEDWATRPDSVAESAQKDKPEIELTLAYPANSGQSPEPLNQPPTTHISMLYDRERERERERERPEYDAGRCTAGLV